MHLTISHINVYKTNSHSLNSSKYIGRKCTVGDRQLKKDDFLAILSRMSAMLSRESNGKASWLLSPWHESRAPGRINFVRTQLYNRNAFSRIYNIAIAIERDACSSRPRRNCLLATWAKSVGETCVRQCTCSLDSYTTKITVVLLNSDRLNSGTNYP